jgi:hydrogenase maturation protein HypF
MIGSGVRSPLASSCGRLFDAVAALTGLAPAENDYEAEAAMRLEAAASNRSRGGYPFLVGAGPSPHFVSFRTMIEAILRDVRKGTSPAVISARFHETLARAAAAVAVEARRDRRVGTVVLGGGVFLNRKLLVRTRAALEREGFEVLVPERYSPNDEAISVGQAAFGLAASL